MGTGASAAVVWFSALTFLTTRLAAGSTARTIADVDPNAVYVNLLVYGAVLGVAFAGYTSWRMMQGIASNYRRGGLSLVAAFSGAVIAGFLTILTRELIGPIGLIPLALVSFVVTVLLAQRTRRVQASVTSPAP